MDKIQRDLCSVTNNRAEEKFQNIAMTYGNDLIRLILAPNTTSVRADVPPSGYTMELKANAPIKAVGIQPQKLFYGTSVYQIHSKHFTNGQLINTRNIEAMRPELEQRLNTMIKETSQNPLKKGNFKEYESCLGGGGAYAGLYVSESRSFYEHQRTYWIVVQSGAPKLSEQIYETIEHQQLEETSRSSIYSGNAVGHTWNNFFFGNTSNSVNFLKTRISNSRERLLYEVSNALNIDVKDQHPDTMGNGSILNATHETFAYDITKKDDVVRYYNQTIDVSSKKTVVFNDNPFVGPIILENVVVPSKESLRNNTGTELAFPVCTGRGTPLNEAKKSALSYGDRNCFVWENDQTANTRLANNLYRPLDGTFIKSIENIKGIQFKKLHKVELKPILVKVCSS